MSRTLVRKLGSSLVELVIVILITGIIAAIAVPRFSKATSTASGIVLRADLKVLRRAIELYTAEHRGVLPDSKIVHQLTKFSDISGTSFGSARDVASGLVLGPYLMSVPPMPVGTSNGKTGIHINPNPGDSPLQGGSGKGR